jgi:hypothetical protein
MRERVYEFLASVLEPKRDPKEFTEPALHPQPVAELRAADQATDVPRADAQKLGAEHLARRPRVTDPKTLAPGLPWHVEPVAIEWRGGEDLPWRPASVRGPDGVPVPLFVGREQSEDPAPWTVVVSPAGSLPLRRATPAWFQGPRRVLIDPRFVGEWQSPAPSWRRNGLWLGCGEGYQCAHDVAQAIASLPGKAPVRLVGLGSCGIVALIAADLCPRVQLLIADDLGPPFAEDGNRLPLCPEILRLGDPIAFFRARLRARCEFVAGGTSAPGGAHAALSSDDLTRLLAHR